MRRRENCTHSRCCLGPAPGMPDLWECAARGGMPVLHPVLRALTCGAYDSRYRLRKELVNDG